VAPRIRRPRNPHSLTWEATADRQRLQVDRDIRRASDEQQDESASGPLALIGRLWRELVG
jgi:hypothetical protein